MKTKTLVTVICFCAIAIHLHAQKTKLLLSAGMSSAFYTDASSSSSSDFKAGFTGGLAVDFKIGRHWAIEPGLSFVQKGGKESDDSYGVTAITNLNYLELPVNMVYSKRDRFFLGFGLFAAYGLSGKVNFKETSDQVDIKFGSAEDDDLKAFDAGINLLVGYRFANGLFFSFNIGASGNDISNDDYYEFSNGYSGIKVGYTLPFKSSK